MKNYLLCLLIIGLTFNLMTSCSNESNIKELTGTDILYENAMKNAERSIIFYSKKDFKYSGFYLPYELELLNETFDPTKKNTTPEKALSSYLSRKEIKNIEHYNLLNKSNLVSISENNKLSQEERIKLLYIIITNDEINYFQFNTFNNNAYIIKEQGVANQSKTLDNFGYDSTGTNTLIYYGNPKKELTRFKVLFDTLKIKSLFKNDPIKSDLPWITFEKLRTKEINAEGGIIFIRDFRESYYRNEMIYYGTTFKL